MVAAQSQNTFKAGLTTANSSTSSTPTSQIASRRDVRLPSVETCILHLRLLTAFSRLRVMTSSVDGLFGVFDSDSEHASEQRWTIFVAKAVGRLERWLESCVRPKLHTEKSHAILPDIISPDSLHGGSSSFHWSTVTPPPLDVLMMLHSYMLNPRDFLQDCLRCNSTAVWLAGFPWEFVNVHLGSSTFEYAVPTDLVEEFERAAGIPWTTDTGPTTTLMCPRCDSATETAWYELYSGDLSQMQKGNTHMPFTFACSNCQFHITQSSLCLAKFSRDLHMLIDGNVPMPGTILGLGGLMPDVHSKEARPLSLNSILQSHPDILTKLLTDSDLANVSQISASVMSQLGEAERKPDVASSPSRQVAADKPILLVKIIRRMTATYDRNASPFALDLVGAVMRQGTFVEKMGDFDWIHSPAIEHHARFAINRYVGFFEVMQRCPDQIAVPTFDVDLVWHTHQLSPQNYYNFSLKYCNNVFIDHDDKIVDDVLSNSFEWTCEEYARITRLPYDKCLCWCCALLEADYQANLQKADKARLKNKLKAALSLFSSGEMSEAEKQVMQIQATKFEKDFAEAFDESGDTNAQQKNKREFFDSYIWHYPMYAPTSEMTAD